MPLVASKISLSCRNFDVPSGYSFTVPLTMNSLLTLSGTLFIIPTIAALNAPSTSALSYPVIEPLRSR